MGGDIWHFVCLAGGDVCLFVCAWWYCVVVTRWRLPRARIVGIMASYLIIRQVTCDRHARRPAGRIGMA